jgi:hypothetical protein
VVRGGRVADPTTGRQIDPNPLKPHRSRRRKQPSHRRISRIPLKPDDRMHRHLGFVVHPSRTRVVLPRLLMARHIHIYDDIPARSKLQRPHGRLHGQDRLRVRATSWPHKCGQGHPCRPQTRSSSARWSSISTCDSRHERTYGDQQRWRVTAKSGRVPTVIVDSLAGMAIARLPVIVVDCSDPGVLARFYGAMLDWKIDFSAERGSVCGENGQCISFHRVDGYTPPMWPSQERPQQMHLDMLVDDLDAAEAVVIDLGATKPPDQPDTYFRVFLDPAGHPFCLCLH